MGRILKRSFKGLRWAAAALGVLLLVVLLGAIILPPLTRGFTDRLGASDEEVASKLAGDDLIPEAPSQSTKAVTIDAPPDLVYALVVQQGMERAGWHGWDWFYKATGSADFVDDHFSRRVVPELQGVKPGDRIKINEMVDYQVVIADRPRAFVMLMAVDAEGEDVNPADPPPVWVGNTMQWVVRRLPDGRTRLILRQRGDSAGQGAFVRWLYDKPLDLGGAVMGYKTLRGIKRTAEDLARNDDWRADLARAGIEAPAGE